MQDALVVRGRKPGAELARDFDRLVFRQPADAPQQRREVLAVDVLHRQEVAAARSRRGRRRGRRSDASRAATPDLVEEPLEPIRIAFDVARQELQRDRLAELQVVGAVDLAHAAAAEQADHAIAAGESVPGRNGLRGTTSEGLSRDCW